MVTLGLHHGCILVTSWLHRGYIMWLHHGYIMVTTSWLHRGYIMVTSWLPPRANKIHEAMGYNTAN